MPIWAWALVMLVASYLLSAITATKPPNQKPASADDFDFPQPDEGTPQIVVFGDVWIEDWMVTWSGNFKSKAIKGGGGKK